MKKKVVLAYSGGLDTSVILHWLVHTKGYDVICFVADIGQQEDFALIEQKALTTGAQKVIIEDLKREFVEQYIFPALKAGAVYEGKYLLGTALARPLIAKKQVGVARAHGTNLLAHGATGKGNDQVRFELTAMSLMPDVQIISTWKDPEFLGRFQGRKDLIAYAQQHQIPVESTLEKPYSIDENIMHTSFESGVLEDPAFYKDVFRKTVSPYHAPDKSVQLKIEFDNGIPVAVTNLETQKTTIGSLEVLTYLNTVGAAHGIGRVDMVENRFVGIKSRGMYEAPGATILMVAHEDLESITLDREVAHLKAAMGIKIAQLIYNGLWESPEMAFLMAAIEQSQVHVGGSVDLELYKGNIIIKGRSSKHSLYNAALVSMDSHGGYNQADAAGFIAIQGLRLKAYNAINQKGKQ